MSCFVMLLAVKSEDYIEIFKKYAEYFSQFHLIKEILRSFGWMILKGLITVINLLYSVIDNVFELLDFMDNEELNTFVGTLRPVVYVVLLFALIYLGYCYIIAHEKPKGVFTNFMLFAITVLVLPWMMVELSNFTLLAKEGMNANYQDTGSYALLRPYITDLLYLDSISFDDKKIAEGSVNGFTDKDAENIKYLDINELMDPDDFKLHNEELFKKQLISEIKEGKETLTVSKIKKSKIIFKDTTPYYYRYHVNFFIAMISFLATIFCLVFSIFNMGRLILELCMEGIMAPFFAAGDITNGQKIRKILTSILSGYICLMVMLFIQRFYIIYCGYINEKQWSDSIVANGFTKAMFLLLGAFFIIDGPNFIEQILGIDAGLKSITQALQSLYYGSQMASSVRNSVKSAGQGAKNMVGKAAGKAAQAGGFLGGLKGAMGTKNEQAEKEMASTPKEAGKEAGSGGQSIASANEDVQNRMNPEEGKKTEQTNPSQKEGNAANSTKPKENAADALNSQINDAVNKNREGQPEMQQPALANWAMKNTRAGQNLTANVQKGREFGEAVGNTLNNLKKIGKHNTNPDTKASSSGNRPGTDTGTSSVAKGAPVANTVSPQTTGNKPDADKTSSSEIPGKAVPPSRGTDENRKNPS